jgi:hypothetical protein
MTLIACVECSGTLSDQARACPHCGFPRGRAMPAVLRKVAATFARRWRRVVGGLVAAAFSAAAIGYTVQWREEQRRARYWAQLKPDSSIKVSAAGVGASYKYLYRKDDRDLTDIIVKRTRWDSVSYSRFEFDCNRRTYRLTAASGDSATIWHSTPVQNPARPVDESAAAPVGDVSDLVCDHELRQSIGRLRSMEK